MTERQDLLRREQKVIETATHETKARETLEVFLRKELAGYDLSIDGGQDVTPDSTHGTVSPNDYIIVPGYRVPDSNTVAYYVIFPKGQTVIGRRRVLFTVTCTPIKSPFYAETGAK